MGLETLGPDKSSAAFHLPIKISILKLELEDIQALIVLLVKEERAGSQDLEADILVEHFVVLEERMDPLVVFVAEVALPHQVHHCDVIIGECQQLVAEEDCVGVIMQVDVLDGELIETLQAFIAEDSGGEGIKFWEKMLEMGAVVGLQDFCHEERPLGFDRGEDSRFFVTHPIQI